MLSTTLFAQQSQPAAEAVEKDVPVQAKQIELAGQLVKYGYQTETALPLIQALQIYKDLNLTKANDGRSKTEEGTAVNSGLSKSGIVSFDETKLVADATRFADGDKNLLALISDVQRATRGAVNGPVREYDRVLAGKTDVWPIRFRGGETAYVVVSGDGDTDLDLYVYDENGNLIASDYDSLDDCVVSFNPRWTGTFYIKIKNLGRVYNEYVLATN